MPHTFRYQSIRYFKGLNTLRFLAAMCVVIHHAQSMKHKYGLGALGSWSFLHNGHNAVIFFFVLSGFLITYLLLKEKKSTGTVRVRTFYLKRVLRIWPLYYLLVLIGTVVLPTAVGLLHLDYEVPYSLGQVWAYFVFFMPGLVTFFYGHHVLEPLWSIGVEELFYLVWAPLFKFVRKNILILLLSVILVKAVLLVIPFFVETSALYKNLVGTYCLEAMAVGGLGAYWVFYSRKDISSLFIFRKWMQVAVYALLLTFILFDSNIRNVVWRTLFGTPGVSALLIDFLYLYMIVGVSLVRDSIVRLENRTLSYMGEISYGIYMYHALVISVLILGLKMLPLPASPILFDVLFYGMLIPGVLGVSHLSKKYFENYFLRLKPKGL